MGCAARAIPTPSTYRTTSTNNTTSTFTTSTPSLTTPDMKFVELYKRINNYYYYYHYHYHYNYYYTSINSYY
ncbi:hypothetical protein Pcinc_033900 [Petrolisthes cinctipes]|uniref:Uncharacterized protein n=1 Tax=Petrolisthes cinctipes TaxID=88211 RepID=A0AAE1K0Y4_PETCI|nr:hypothetical protein Pcinc_033900 [Petrolisthes cinctipes]